MRRFFLLLITLLPLISFGQTPCNLTSAGGCDCPDGSDNCDLLPDIKPAYSYTASAGNRTETLGELRLGTSTTNIGYGPLRVISTEYFVCGTDTVYSPGGYSGTCPDGNYPKQLIKQRVYQKSGTSMTYYDRWAGSMTYHVSHGHMHVDDWGVFTLRIATPGVDNPLEWPTVGDGTKTAFCLMDFGNCSYYNGHCTDADGNILTNDGPNYGLGGGSYSCGLTNQGISCGYTDIYSKALDGMSISIPPGTCNGDYMIVVEIDPDNHFLESTKDNNVIAVPVTLTQQTGTAAATISVDGATNFCQGNSVNLSASAGFSYLWSSGETSQSIDVDESGMYTCTVETICGAVVTDPVEVSVTPILQPEVSGGMQCGPGALTLGATASGSIDWYDAEIGGTYLGSGNEFTTPELSESTTYWVENLETTPGALEYGGPLQHTGTSQYAGTQYNSHLVFDCYSPVTLKSVKVFTDMPGERTIELRNSAGEVLQNAVVNIAAGESRVNLEFSLTPGVNYQLGTNGAANLTNFGYESPDLKRTSGGLSFPYNVNSWISIKDTPFGTSYYYYFYDWEVQEPSQSCSSPRTPVVATIDNSPGCGLPVTCDPPVSMTSTVNSAHSATIGWESIPGAIKYQVKGRPIGSTGFATLVTSASSKSIGGLQAGTTYEWKMRVLCWNNEVSEFSPMENFTTMTPKLNEQDLKERTLVYPNPTDGIVNIDITSPESGPLEVSAINILGQIVSVNSINNPDGNISLALDLTGQSPGIYLIKIQSGEKTANYQITLTR